MTPDELKNLEAILHSPSYRLAEQDTDFLKLTALRPVRLQLELLKPEMTLEDQKVRSTIVVFGSTQIIERSDAEARLSKAREVAAVAPDDARLVREVHRCERLLAMSEHYDAAREF